MKIVADTNVYYRIGNDQDLKKKLEGVMLSPTFLNVGELCSSPILIKDETYVRNAMQVLCSHLDRLIIDPPYVHIAKLFCDIQYDIPKQSHNYIEFIERVSAGEKVKQESVTEFQLWQQDMRSNSNQVADYVNDLLTTIRPNIKDKKAHRAKDTKQLTLQLVNNLVENVTGAMGNLYDIDLKPIELFVNTLDLFFKDLEVHSTMKMKPNDLTDFSILAYVQPNDQFLTFDGPWNDRINRVGKEYQYSF